MTVATTRAWSMLGRLRLLVRAAHEENRALTAAEYLEHTTLLKALDGAERLAVNIAAVVSAPVAERRELTEEERSEVAELQQRHEFMRSWKKRPASKLERQR